jgi:hypothetical protein
MNETVQFHNLKVDPRIRIVVFENEQSKKK